MLESELSDGFASILELELDCSFDKCSLLFSGDEDEDDLNT